MKFLSKRDRQMKNLRSQQRKVEDYQQRIKRSSRNLPLIKNLIKEEESESMRCKLMARYAHVESLIEHYQRKIESNQ